VDGECVNRVAIEIRMDDHGRMRTSLTRTGNAVSGVTRIEGSNPSRSAFRIHTADIRRWLSTRVAAAHESSLSGGQERDAYAAVGDPRRRATFVMLGGTSFITRWVTPWAGVAR
jgi:hypothetical protein